MSAEYEEVRSDSHVGFLTHFDGDNLRVLSGFGLRFQNHDHPVGWISAGGATGDIDSGEPVTFLLALSDMDHPDPLASDDPTEMWAKVMCLSPRRLRIAYGSGRTSGAATAPVEVGDDEHFMLRGFHFRAGRNSNHNIRRIGVRFDRERRSVEVVFRDNSPTDDSYRFEVLYTTQDRSHPFWNGPYRENFDFVEETLVQFRKRGEVVLSGFDFEFVDNDHHLREISIDPIDDRRFRVRFTDDERDNRVRAMVEYLVWQPYVY